MESEWTTEFEEPRTIKDHINRHLAQKEFDLRRNKMEKLHMYIEDVHNVTTGTDITDDNFTSISQRPPNLVNSNAHVNLSVPYTDMVAHKSFWQAQPVINLKELTETSVQNYKDLLNNKNNSRLQNSSILSFNVQSKYYENPIILKKWYPFLSTSGKLSFQGLESEKPITTDHVVYRYSTKRFADAQGVVYLLSGQLKYHSNMPKYIYENFCGGIPYSWKEINLEWVEFVKTGSSLKFEWGKFLNKDKNFNMIQTNGKKQNDDESFSNLTFTKKNTSPIKRNTNVIDINSPENYTFDFNRPSMVGGHVNSTPLNVKHRYEINKTSALSGTNTTMSRSNKSVSSVQMLKKKIAKLQAMLEVAEQREFLYDDSIVSEMESMEMQKTKLNRMEKLKDDKRPFAHLNFERDKEVEEKSLKSNIDILNDVTRKSKDSSVFKVPSSVPLSMTLLRRKNKDLNNGENKSKDQIVKKHTNEKNYSQNEESSHKKCENHLNKHKIQYVDVDVHKELYDTSYYNEKQKSDYDTKKNKTLKILSSSDSDDDCNHKTNSRILSKNDPIDLKRKYNPTDTPPPPNKRKQIEIVEARIGVTDTEAGSFIDTDEQMSDSCDTFKTAKNSVSQVNQIINKEKQKIESLNASFFDNKKNNLKFRQEISDEKETINITNKTKSNSIVSSKNVSYNPQKSVQQINNKYLSEDILKNSKYTDSIRILFDESASESSDEKNNVNRSKNPSINFNRKDLSDVRNANCDNVNKEYLKESNKSNDGNPVEEGIKIKTMNRSKSSVSSGKKKSREIPNVHNISHSVSINTRNEIPILSDSEQGSVESGECNIKIVGETSGNKQFKANISSTNTSKRIQCPINLRKSSLKNLMTSNIELNETYKKPSSSTDGISVRFSDQSVIDSDTSLKEKLEHIISLITTKSNTSKSNDNYSDTQISKITPNEPKTTPGNKKVKNTPNKMMTKKKLPKQLNYSHDNLTEDDPSTKMNDEKEDKRNNIYNSSNLNEIETENIETCNKNLNKRRKSSHQSPLVNIKILDNSDLADQNKTPTNYNLRQTRKSETANSKEVKILKSNKKSLPTRNSRKSDQNDKHKKTPDNSLLSRRDLLISLIKKSENSKSTKKRKSSYNKITNLKSNKKTTTNRSKANSSSKNQNNKKSVRLVNYSLNTSSDLCTDSDEDDEDGNNSSDTDNDNSEIVLLKNWRPEVETMYCSNCFVLVVGDKISASGKIIQKDFKSAEITERFSNNKIQDVNRTTYILQGKLHDPKSVVPDKLKNILKNGFPINAFEMMDKWYTTAREIYENIQNKINVSEKDFNNFEEKINASGLSLIESDDSDDSSKSHSQKSNQKTKKASRIEQNKRKEKRNGLDEYNFSTVNNETFNISTCDRTQKLLNITTMSNVNASRYGRIRKAPVNYWEGERFVCMKDQMYYKPPDKIVRETRNTLKLSPKKTPKKLNKTFLKSSSGSKKSIQRESSDSSPSSIISQGDSPINEVQRPITRRVASESKIERVRRSKRKTPVKTEEKSKTNLNSRKKTKIDGKENTLRKLHDKRNKSKPNEKVISSKVIKKDRQNNLKKIKDKINFNKKNTFEAKEKIVHETSSDYTDSGIVHTPNSVVYNDCYVILEKVSLESQLNLMKQNTEIQTKTINKTFTKPRKHKRQTNVSLDSIPKHKCKRISAKKYFDIDSDYNNSITSESDNVSLVLQTNMEHLKKSGKKRRLYNEQEWLYELSKQNEEYFKSPMSLSDLSNDVKNF